MICRVKDPKRRNLVNELLSIENFKSSTPNPEIKVLFVVDGITRARIFLGAEPVQELAEGWHPFPQTKPQKEGTYLIALKRNDDRELDFVDAAGFAGNSFSAFHSDIIAWREMPKIWKEQG